MAEKFICVRKYDSPCEKCEVKKICGRDCVFKEMFEKDPYKITRQEAIKKISSHLLMCDISTMDTDEIAEAALNALLED